MSKLIYSEWLDPKDFKGYEKCTCALKFKSEEDLDDPNDRYYIPGRDSYKILFYDADNRRAFFNPYVSYDGKVESGGMQSIIYGSYIDALIKVLERCK